MLSAIHFAVVRYASGVTSIEARAAAIACSPRISDIKYSSNGRVAVTCVP
jgi:hypothetical protein